MNTVSCLLAVHLLLGNMFAKGFLDSWKQRWRRSCQKIEISVFLRTNDFDLKYIVVKKDK
jgi:hypothetical protein